MYRLREKLSPYVRPWPYSLAAIGALFIYFWAALSGIDYDAVENRSTSTTGGWFILALPFTIGMAVAYAVFVTFVARRLHPIAACVFLAPTIWLAALSVSSMTPDQRIATIIGERAASRTSIERLRSHDSFNDGVTTYGILSGPEDVFEQIIEYRSLKLNEEAPLYNLGSYFDDDSIPEFGPAYGNDRSLFYRHADSGKIYFRHRAG